MGMLASDSADGRARPTGAIRRRSGFRLDMTPLVDVAFLLLTFFMFATTMVRPQIMEIRVPPDLSGVPVAQQDLLTIYIGRDGRIFYSDGAADPKPLSSSELRRFAVDRNETHGNDLVTVLKADPDVPYASMIEVLDRLNLAESDLAGLYIGRGEIRERRFTVAAMSDVDRRRIAAAMER